MMTPPVTVRPLQPSDLDAVVRIDEKLTGQARKDYWHTRFDIAALRPPWMTSVAEMDGRVVGFLFGWVGESEFGMAGDALGLKPEARRKLIRDNAIELFRL